MPAVPDDLSRRFEKWDSAGRPPQGAFEWNKKNWQKYFGEDSVLETLPNPIDRSGVTEVFKRIGNADSALDAYIASYLWGYAKTGFGPYRAARVIRLNTESDTETDTDSGKNFAAELAVLADKSMTLGGVEAFRYVVEQRRRDRRYFAYWGPAFATKFISFATLASDRVAITTIMDSIVATWFRTHCPEIGPLWLTWHSADSYTRYTSCIAEWAEKLGITPDQVEQLIFRRA